VKILVVSPHPDDETLGCGGSLLRYQAERHELYWMIVTGISESEGWSAAKVKSRDREIELVTEKYKFSNVFNFRFPTTKLDTIPLSELIVKISEVHQNVKPEIIYMPFAGDVHTDHQIIAKALQSTLKWFRYPHVRKVLMYETSSETNFNFICSTEFRPNVFLDISPYLD
jgi:LmbE family N-acetylglucosaminyl deacetylase